MSLSSIAQLYNHPLIRKVEESSCQGSCITKWKIAFGVILFLEGVFFGHLVFLVRRLKSNNSTSRFSTTLQFGNALAAGVFFATGFLHILPEGIGLLSGEHDHGAEKGHVGHRQEDHEGHDHEDEHDHGDEHDEKENGHDDEKHSNHEEEEGEEHDHEEGKHSNHAEGEEGEEEENISFPTAFLIVIISFYAFFFLEKILLPKLFGSKVEHTHGDEVVNESSSNEEQLEDGQLGEKQIESQPENARFFSKAFTMGLFKILGISAHSFIESMALGVSSSFSLSLNIFIATVSHRWATAVAITFPLVRDLGYFPFLVLLLLFSAMVPLGIGVGSALSSLSSQVQGVLFCISAGTFLYMGAYELMVDAYVGHTKWQFAKFLTTIFGVVIIVSITAILTSFDIHG